MTDREWWLQVAENAYLSGNEAIMWQCLLRWASNMSLC